MSANQLGSPMSFTQEELLELVKNSRRYLWLREKGGKKYSDPLPGIPAVGTLYDIAVEADMIQEALRAQRPALIS
ncbi:hypothetical protein D3C84_1253570 [compost metagenome]